MDKFKLLIKGQEQNTFTIHYSCNGFYDGGAIAPTICTIAIANLKTNELHTFSLQNYILQGKSLIDSEKELLSNFVNFFNSLENPIFIHWNMESLAFGFKAIRARCENYGFYDLSFANLIAFNLSDFTSNSLQNLLKENNCYLPDFLHGKQELDCFLSRNYNMVKLSTEAKTIGLKKVAQLALEDKAVMYNYSGLAYGE
ncbi:MAG: hypothetical protein IJW73_09375 [Candidatus Gastranaerophilales bacterium]|nr:hypothetical protein [Candidatus Gastranaerophilales bacterium]